MSYLCTRISRNTGIVGKLRHCTSLLQLKQLYYNLIYPYISYAITSWGSAFTTQIKKIQTKQNHVIRVMFFATLFGPDTDSALPLLNLLDLLTVTNIYKLQLLNFTHQWHSKKLPNIFNQHFRYASEVHTYNTRHASKSNFYDHVPGPIWESKQQRLWRPNCGNSSLPIQKTFQLITFLKY